jgi:hypothetical protein
VLVRLADHDRACISEARDERRVPFGGLRRDRGAASRGRVPPDVEQVLHRDRDPGERALPFELGVGSSLIGEHLRERVRPPLPRVDALERGVDGSRGPH